MRIHKLARLVYTMLTKGEEYTDKGHDYDEERYRDGTAPSGKARIGAARRAFYAWKAYQCLCQSIVDTCCAIIVIATHPRVHDESPRQPHVNPPLTRPAPPQHT